MAKTFESNVIRKDHRKIKIKVAICYPGPYRVGMSCLAIHILYSMLNLNKDVACERAFFQPFPTAGIRTLESNMPLRKMDILGFSLQYENDYTNVLRMLIDSGIPLLAKDRKEKDPLVIAGGPCATGNPEPLSDFVDLFVIGEAEPILAKLIDLAVETKIPRNHIDEFMDIEGLYIPSLNQESVKRVWVKDLDSVEFPIRQIITHTAAKSQFSPIFGETFLAEATRGCGHGCRFCYTGYIGRPYRERAIDNMEELIKQGVAHTGVGKVSLIGYSLSDYSRLLDLCSWAVDKARLKLSVSSLRADSASTELLKILAKGGERTLTIAPETGSQTLRNSLSKKITDEDIVQTAGRSLDAGLRNVKLYFMIGLPGETSEDIDATIDLVKRIAKLDYQSRSIRLSVAPFVPKPHTPFQWCQQASQSDLEAKLKVIRSSLGTNSKIDVESVDLRWARIQSILSVGDRRIGKILEYVAQKGGTLGAWKQTMRRAENAASICEPNWTFESELPWDKIRVGVSKDFLKAQMQKATAREESPSCLTECSNCGVC